MHMKNFFLTISLTVIELLLFQNTFCQKNFKQGYIILLNSDTVKGYVNCHNWGENPRKIFFKKTLNVTDTIYTPVAIKGFYVSGKIYKSSIISTEISPVIPDIVTPQNIVDDKSQYNPEFIMEKDTAFIMVFIQGKKSLYYYRNRLGKEQFYIKQDTSKGYELLAYKKYLFSSVLKNAGLVVNSMDANKSDDKYYNPTQKTIMEKDNYLDQLSLYLKDCPTIQSIINKTKYTQSSLEKLFLSYSYCPSLQK